MLRLSRNTLTKSETPLASCQYLWHAGVCRFGLGLVPGLAVLDLPAWRQPAPMERTGPVIDHTVACAQRGVGGFSQEAGRNLVRASRWAGDAARAAGAQIHDWLETGAPEDPAAWR